MDDDTPQDAYIDFPGMIDHAMREVVRQSLLIAESEGLPGDHHFFISFKTDFPGVQISEALKSRYPGEMTIVLQHQFWDLKVEDDFFSVTLSFNNVPEKLVVPFLALTAFADPSVKFGLQFHTMIDEELLEELIENEQDLLNHLEQEGFIEIEDDEDEVEKPAASKSKKAEKGGDANVVTLDAFRKDNKKKPTPPKKKK